MAARTVQLLYVIAGALIALGFALIAAGGWFLAAGRRGWNRWW